MTTTETRNTACAWMEAMAADDSHGYDQASRWGPDYDCSSLVISAWKKAGIPLTCTYTGNMKADMLSHGFRDVTGQVNLATGSGLKKADVLLHETHHTAMYIGGGKLVHAAGNEYGKATGGRTGDQTGREIVVCGYYNFPWQCVLRYEGKDGGTEAPDPAGANTYVVKAGDSFWAIAARELGDGCRCVELAEYNGLTVNAVIHPGQVLKLPGKGAEGPGDPSAAPQDDSEETESVSVALPVLRKGAAGAAVKALQTLLLNAGIDVGSCGVDGEYGEDTWVAVCDLQRRMNVTADGEVKAAEWKALITEGSK